MNTSAKVSIVLLAFILLFAFLFVTHEKVERTKEVEVVHFEHNSSCGKTCVSSNRIYYIENGSMKSWNVGSSEYWKGATVEIRQDSGNGIGYLFMAILLSIILLPFAYYATDKDYKDDV